VFTGYEKGGFMEEPKKVFVSIYCKLLNDCFSREMVNRMATGQEIYDFLMKDAGLCEDEDNNYEKIPGDCNLWYLGCNEKFGILQYKHIILDWGLGESSFDKVTTYIALLYLDKVFTDEQYGSLMSKILEGRKIDNMYDIKTYLIAKKKGKPWVKTKDSEMFRGDMKKFMGRVVTHFQNEWYLLYNPTTH
jgi:hypothetical protein